MTSKFISIRGAREHNLKNISVELPRERLVVITGLSGSGKSSLAFDTIYAEGQRRYVESLSAYARQFLGLMEKPDVDSIEGLSPAISIEQKSAGHNPRSTGGTRIEVLSPLVRSRKGEFRDLFENARKQGFVRAVVDGSVIELAAPPRLNRKVNHDVSIVVDRLVVRGEDRGRLTDSLETALRLADGVVEVKRYDTPAATSQHFSERYGCAHCGLSLPEME